MHILYINHYAGSPIHGMEFRPYYLAREWVRNSHRVHILAADFSHVRSSQPDVAGLQAAGARQHGKSVMQKIDDIYYHWYPTMPYAGNGVERARNIGDFLWQVWADAALLARSCKPDVVIASSTYPMDIWVAQRIRRHMQRMGRPCALVYEVHDLWPLSPMELGGMSKWHPFIMLCQAAENYACRRADAVISMLPNAGIHLRAHGLDLERLHIVPNGIDVSEWQGAAADMPPDLAAHIAQQRAAGRTIVGYTGSHGSPNALDVLLQAAALLKDAPLSFVLVGDGHEKAHLQQQAQILGLQAQHVAFFAPIAKAQIPSLLASIDIAYIGWQALPIYRFGIAPNKLMDYMMAGCVVLHSSDAGNDPVSDAECGLTVPAAKPKAIAKGLQQLAELDSATRQRMGQAGRAYVQAHHTYPMLAQRFVLACQQALAQQKIK